MITKTRLGGVSGWICLGILLAHMTDGGWAGEPGERVTAPTAAEVLSRLKAGHPRLLVSSQDLVRLERRVREHARLGEWHASLVKRGQELLKAAPSKYEIPDGLRLLGVSRRVVDRVYTLALLNHLDHDAQYAERAWKELEAAADFPDWNPRHFLDTAEMTHAFAIGYDWLHEYWKPAQRERLRGAMVEKGLKPALEIYRKKTSWTRARHNWNQVCNGGIGMGALALADAERDLCGELVSAALASLPLAMREYGPDGAWAEGPGYWRYASQYNVVFLAALESALGTDFGLSDLPGFRHAGLFPIYLTGPLGRTFNYADGSDGTIRSPEMFWLAGRFQIPSYAQYQARVAASPQPLDLVWLNPSQLEAVVPPLPLHRYFRAAEVVTLRSDWSKPDGVFVGFKAGDNKANHSNLDLGTFVFDASGVRWALDLGADNYNLPGYFGKQRWTYYRLRAEGHNTLVLNPGTDPDQDPAAATRILKFNDAQAERAFALADLTPAYAKHATAVKRGICLLDRQRLLVQDEVSTGKNVDAWWFLHTPAEIQLAADGRSATLRRDGKSLSARVLAPETARFAVLDAGPLPTSPKPEGQNPNRDIRKLAIHLADTPSFRLAVTLTPESTDPTQTDRPVPVIPLAEW